MPYRIAKEVGIVFGWIFILGFSTFEEIILQKPHGANRFIQF